MDKRRLITKIKIDEIECSFNADFRNIIDILQMLDNPDLTTQERVEVALAMFYDDDNYLIDITQAANAMFEFISYCSEEDTNPTRTQTRLYDWEQDFDIITSAVNKVLTYDVRGKDFLHWWTFLSAFMEIGDGTFNTFVQIRDKQRRGRKLEKWEKEILRDNGDRIRLKKRVDETTQNIIDNILKGGI